MYERGTASGSLFRRQLYEKNLLTKDEYEELGKLEGQMNLVHPIVDGVIFLGKFCKVVCKKVCVLYFQFRHECGAHG